jgi:hypothetical protein
MHRHGRSRRSTWSASRAPRLSRRPTTPAIGVGPSLAQVLARPLQVTSGFGPCFAGRRKCSVIARLLRDGVTRGGLRWHVGGHRHSDGSERTPACRGVSPAQPRTFNPWVQGSSPWGPTRKTPGQRTYLRRSPWGFRVPSAVWSLHVCSPASAAPLALRACSPFTPLSRSPPSFFRPGNRYGRMCAQQRPATPLKKPQLSWFAVCGRVGLLNPAHLRP